MTKKENNKKIIAINRRARFDYQIEEVIEAGIILLGTEVKALRLGKASINESYATYSHGDIQLINAYIPEYGKAGQHLQHDPKRQRKLLLHTKEIKRLFGLIRLEKMTIIPLECYFNKQGKVKVLLGLAKGRKKVDKREMIKKRDWDRDKSRLLKTSRREK